jgi:hypothetical protein
MRHDDDFDSRYARDLEHEPTLGQRPRPKLTERGTLRTAHEQAMRDTAAPQPIVGDGDHDERRAHGRYLDSLENETNDRFYRQLQAERDRERRASRRRR